MIRFFEILIKKGGGKGIYILSVCGWCLVIVYY